VGRSTSGRGRIAFSRNRVLRTGRRVVVKVRIARHQGCAFRSAPMSAQARMFDTKTDHADDAAFANRSKDDRHHFHFIVSPEDAPR
jgi:hypothetical protein